MPCDRPRPPSPQTDAGTAREIHGRDRYAKELQGERLFNLLLYGLIRCKRLSQRKLEKVFESRAFCTLFD